MLDVMTQAKNAIESYNVALRVSSANIASMNVPGYKKLETSFQTIFDRVISQGTAASADQGGTNPKQLGQGMSISGMGIDFSSGDTTAGTSLDLAIVGSGLFVVSADGGASYLYTRTGNFRIDSAGNLTSNGLQVYGLDNSGTLTPIQGLPSGVNTDYQWLADGRLQYSADGGTTYTDTGYRIALSTFPNPSGLAQASGTSFAETLASGSASAPITAGGAAGTIKSGYVEQSNVVYLEESITSLELQRALSANLSMLKTASDMISNVIQKLG